MGSIPFLDLPAQCNALLPEIMPSLERVISGAQFILGEDVELFEEKFAAWCGTDYCIGVSSGTEALHLALRSLGIGPGDEVITSVNTFAATALAITYAGATPVFVDVDPSDYNIDVGRIEDAITPRTRAILPVHLYGQPARIHDILDIAGRHGLHVVEDACQAHGAYSGNRRVGSFGDLGCFSFYPGKNLGAFGDGGAIVTSDRSLAGKLRLLRNYGQQAKNVHVDVGFNSRLDSLQAAVLLVKLNYLDDWNERRREIARSYNALLADCALTCPVENDGVQHVYHLYVLQHERRNELIEHLRNLGVQTGIHYPTPLNRMIPFRGLAAGPEATPVADGLAGRILSLPMYPELSDDDVARVADAVLAFDSAIV